MTMHPVSVEEVVDNGTRHIAYCRGGMPRIGLEITADGTIVVGHWLPDGVWQVLATSDPADDKEWPRG